LLRVGTSRAPGAQTPKQVIWTLNKAKLYRYIPAAPAEWHLDRTFRHAQTASSRRKCLSSHCIRSPRALGLQDIAAWGIVEL
jgi:hypothetical protein